MRCILLREFLVQVDHHQTDHQPEHRVAGGRVQQFPTGRQVIRQFAQNRQACNTQCIIPQAGRVLYPFHQQKGEDGHSTGLHAEIMGSKGNPYYDAPTVVLVFAPADSRNAVQDASCVLENMMLAAHALGLGSCWINREIEMFRTSEGHDLMVRELGLPEGLTGVGAISLGYPDGAPSPCKPRKEGYARIVR